MEFFVVGVFPNQLLVRFVTLLAKHAILGEAKKDDNNRKNGYYVNNHQDVSINNHEVDHVEMSKIVFVFSVEAVC